MNWWLKLTSAITLTILKYVRSIKRDIKGRRDEDMVDINTRVYLKQTFAKDMPDGVKLYLFLTDLSRCYSGINHSELSI